MLLHWLVGLAAGLAAVGPASAADPVWQPVDVKVVYKAPELESQLAKDDFGTGELDRLLIGMLDKQLVFWNLRAAPAPRLAEVPLLTVTLSETDEPVSTRQLRFALKLEVPGDGPRIPTEELEAFGRVEYATAVLAKGQELADAVVGRIRAQFEAKASEFWRKVATVPVAKGVVNAPGLENGHVVAPLPGVERFRRYARSVFLVESSAVPAGPWNQASCSGLGSFWPQTSPKYLMIAYQAQPAAWPLQHRTIWLQDRKDQTPTSTEYDK